MRRWRWAAAGAAAAALASAGRLLPQLGDPDPPPRERRLPAPAPAPARPPREAGGREERVACDGEVAPGSGWTPRSLGPLRVEATVVTTLYRSLAPPAPLLNNMLWHHARAAPVPMLVVALRCPLGASSAVPAAAFQCWEVPPGPCRCAAAGRQGHGNSTPLHARCKFALVLSILRQGSSVLWVDSDAALLAPLFSPAAHIPRRTVLEGCHDAGFHVNLGLFWASPAAEPALAVTLRSLHLPVSVWRRSTLSEQQQGATTIRWRVAPWVAEQAYVSQLLELSRPTPEYALPEPGAGGYARVRYHWSAPIRVQRGGTLGRAGLWPRRAHACRGWNRAHVAVWRKAAQQRTLATAHASGGAAGHRGWGKVGFLIEMCAWWNRSETQLYWRRPPDTGRPTRRKIKGQLRPARDPGCGREAHYVV
eukprot:TRINITY_DN35624_c0_g1_i1.p2 TRINITY_DN35624_c0_g1~~TRINITY_DN35624_c0_g1_i1.p2  ORF type:complete len:441 (+),score=63.80 TRINITY_DN35624_c0_g1_i1:61-1323(+)